MEEILRNLDDASEDADRNEIQSKLSSMSFEDLQKLKSELGTKLYKEAYFGTKGVKQSNFKRLNKNRPREASSKIKPKPPARVSALKNARDPRFDSACGTFNKNIFEKNYSFVNDVREKEKKQLKEMLRVEKNEVKADKIKYLLQRMNNQDRERLRREKEQAKRNEERQEQIEALKSGRKPHFKSKYERKVGNIVEKYEELKESGKLMKYIEKKNKKNSQKQKRYFEHDLS